MTIPTASDTMSLQRIPHVLAACLAGLLLLGATMFVAMLAGVPPHPPGERGPYLGAVCAMAVASLWMLTARQSADRWAALAPLIVAGTGLIVAGAVRLWREWTHDA